MVSVGLESAWAVGDMPSPAAASSAHILSSAGPHRPAIDRHRRPRDLLILSLPPRWSALVRAPSPASPTDIMRRRSSSTLPKSRLRHCVVGGSSIACHTRDTKAVARMLGQGMQHDILIATMARTSRTAQQRSASGADKPAVIDTSEAAPLPLESAGLPASMLSREQLRSVLESLLFIAGRALELGELRRLLSVDEPRLRAAIQSLAEECEQALRGVRVQRADDSVQLVSAPENARFVAAFLGLPTQARLTTAALDTLAVVAYRQPITRSQIEFVRGVNSDRALAGLLQHGLVVEVGRAATVGRPALFGTTPEFLQQFGLTSLDALPRPEAPRLTAVEEQRATAASRIRAAVGGGDDEAMGTT